MDVRCGGNDRRSMQHVSQRLRQRVCPTDVTGENRNNKARPVVDHKHCRVRLFAADEGRNLPHGNAARADENERAAARKFRAVDAFFKRQKAGLGKARKRIADGIVCGESRQNPPCGLTAGAAVAEDCRGHSLASRNSVEKPG